MKLKHIALAVLAATSFGAANAAINYANGAAQLYFAAQNAAGTYSYVYNTGSTLASLKDGSISFTASLSADTVWQQFLTDIGGVSNAQWTVGAYNGGTGANRNFYSTVSATSAFVTAPNMPTYSTLGTFSAPLTALLGNEGLPGSYAAGDSQEYTSAFAVQSYAVAGIDSLFNAVGTSGVKFLGLTGTSTTATSKLVGITTIVPTAAFTSTGTLTIGSAVVVPSVPEPESYGLALVGLLLAGAVARRRAA
jgi:MYXO-CTERM domain-containing protein